MSYEIHLKETTPGYINLELLKDGKVETFCDTNISKEFLYQFGEEYVQSVCESTVGKIRLEEEVCLARNRSFSIKWKPNLLFSLFATSFIFNQEEICSQFQPFYYEIISINQIDQSDAVLWRIAWVFFNASQFRNPEGFLNARSKLLSLRGDYENLGEEIVLDGLYFKYIEAVDKWKTKETHELQRIKQFQSERQMSDFSAKVFDENFGKFIGRKNIDTIAIIPNNQVRQTNFNAFIEQKLKRDFPEYRFWEILLNAYEWREAQKSTQGLEQRIKNAKKLFIVHEASLKDAKNILLIDDVFGSGATMNSVAQSIKNINPDANIIGFAMIGSYRKGFDVVNEV